MSVPLPNHPNFKNLTGQRFGRLVVVEFAGRVPAGRQTHSQWRLKCDCGREHITLGTNLNNGTCKSCGCLAEESRRESNRTHGQHGTRLYTIWNGMRERCHNVSDDKSYKQYGAKGITVCDEWRYSFEAFYEWSMANGYRDDLTIDRFPHRQGNYEPSNCRWATITEQARNKDSVIVITAFGESKTAIEWAQDPRSVVGQGTIRGRVNKGWDHEKAITTPTKIPAFNLDHITAFGETKSMAEWSRDPRCVPNYRALVKRIRRGFTPEQAITLPLSSGHLYEKAFGVSDRKSAVVLAKGSGIERGTS